MDSAVHSDFERTDLRDDKLSIDDTKTWLLRISDGVIAAFTLEARIPGLHSTLLQATEKAVERTLYTKQYVLENLGMNFLETGNPRLVGLQNLLLPDADEPFFGLLVVITAIHKARIVQNTAHLQRSL